MQPTRRRSVRRGAMALTVSCILASAACVTPPDGGAGDVRGTGAGADSGLPTSSGNTDNVAVADFGDPTDIEQFMLELINRARADPAAEAGRLGLSSVDEGTGGKVSDDPQPPLAMNAKLIAAARKHSRDMLDRNFFGHVNPDGVGPFDRITDAGYNYRAAAENIAFHGSSGALNRSGSTADLYGDLFVDTGVSGRGHRVNILGPNYTEIGIGIGTGPYTGSSGTPLNAIMATQDFGAPGESRGVFVLGVAYTDANFNGRYDPGEGLGGVSVGLDGVTVTTPGSGGYAFLVGNDGSYAITFSGGPLGNLAGTVTVAGSSKKVDAITGLGLIGTDR